MHVCILIFFLWFSLVNNLLILFRLFIPMEITSKLDLCPHHGLGLCKHGVSELNTNCVLSTLINIILIVVIWPHHSVVHLFVFRIKYRKLNPIFFVIKLSLETTKNYISTSIIYYAPKKTDLIYILYYGRKTN